MTINMFGVSIGDKFKTGQKTSAVVIDILEKKSLANGSIIGYLCIAKGLGIASNSFEVPFSTVKRGLINE